MMTTHTDGFSGLAVRRLTDGFAQFQTLYFNRNPTFDAGRRLLVTRRDASGMSLMAIQLDDGTSTELYRPEPGATLGRIALQSETAIAYFWSDKELRRIDLGSGQAETIYRCPDGWNPSSPSISATGAALRCAINEDFSARLGERNRFQHAHERTIMQSPPRARVVSIPTSGGVAVEEFEEEAYITHVECSPTIEELFTYCHEGPWLEVDQRIWGLRAGTGAPWAIYPKDPRWGVGHEFWLADGERIGYHARYCEGRWRHAAGVIRYDNSDHKHAEMAVPTQHMHAQDDRLLICDGTREAGDYLIAVQSDDADGWQQPRVICRHDCSRHHDGAHAHAHLLPDRRRIIFTSDRRRAFSDVYLVELPEDLDELPLWQEKPYRYYWA